MKGRPHVIFIWLILSVFSVFAEEPKPDETILIPMRDGTLLPTDLYFPTLEASLKTRSLPCILIRSPYGRQGAWLPFTGIKKLGFVVAVQDTRNVIDPEGKTLPFISDGWGRLQDGYDSVEWLAKSPYTNGQIGTWGASALGITQQMMAPSAPPSLKCQYIMFASASLYHDAAFYGGQFLKHQVEGWMGYYASDPGILSYLSQRCFYNPFWHNLNTVAKANRITVPALHYGGWYDLFLQGTLAAFVSRQEFGGEGAKGTQKLVIGPWTHFWPLERRLGDFEIPATGLSPPIDISPERWFEHYLKGVSNGIESIPAVTYFVMGPLDGSPSKGNVWKSADKWPVPATETSWYLSPENLLSTSLSYDDRSLSYLYDPENPIPTIGGRNLFLASGPKDQQTIENREDLIVFTSPALEKDLEVTGSLAAKLFVHSDQPDTDIVIRLTDVYPDGRSILISDGVSRLCFTYGARASQNSNQPFEITVDLGATSQVFAKGHRIRLSISSSNYPRYEKNMNTGFFGSHEGSPYQKARNTIFIGKNRPSRLVLPTIP